MAPHTVRLLMGHGLSGCAHVASMLTACPGSCWQVPPPTAAPCDGWTGSCPSSVRVSRARNLLWGWQGKSLTQCCPSITRWCSLMSWLMRNMHAAPRPHSEGCRARKPTLCCPWLAGSSPSGAQGRPGHTLPAGAAQSCPSPWPAASDRQCRAECPCSVWLTGLFLLWPAALMAPSTCGVQVTVLHPQATASAWEAGPALHARVPDPERRAT